MTDTIKALMPCPFCGGEANYGRGHGYDFVNCTEGCADNSTQADMCGWTKEDAAEAWNARPAITTMYEENKRLREAIGQLLEGYEPLTKPHAIAAVNAILERGEG